MQITLPAIAFGGSASAGAIPPARDATARWLRAVALGGQGFYAAAQTELRRIDDDNCGSALRSLAASTRAAHLRQGGRHHRAADHDGTALYLAGPRDRGHPAASDPETGDRGADDRVATVARCDALTGLAADNLGRGMFAASDRLLDRVERILGDREQVLRQDQDQDQDRHDDVMSWIWGPRPELRWRWVRAELAMYTADPAAAIEHAAAAQTIAMAGPSVRHRIKTELIGAAAAAASGNCDAAGDRARRVFDSAEAARQLPLQWAAAKLLDGIGAGEGSDAGECWAGRADQLGSVLAARGGVMR